MHSQRWKKRSSTALSVIRVLGGDTRGRVRVWCCPAGRSRARPRPRRDVTAAVSAPPPGAPERRSTEYRGIARSARRRVRVEAVVYDPCELARWSSCEPRLQAAALGEDGSVRFQLDKAGRSQLGRYSIQRHSPSGIEERGGSLPTMASIGGRRRRGGAGRGRRRPPQTPPPQPPPQPPPWARRGDARPGSFQQEVDDLPSSLRFCWSLVLLDAERVGRPGWGSPRRTRCSEVLPERVVAVIRSDGRCGGAGSAGAAARRWTTAG